MDNPVYDQMAVGVNEDAMSVPTVTEAVPQTSPVYSVNVSSGGHSLTTDA